MQAGHIGVAGAREQLHLSGDASIVGQEGELEGEGPCLGVVRALRAEDDAIGASGCQAEQAPGADDGARRKGCWVDGARSLQGGASKKGQSQPAR